MSDKITTCLMAAVLSLWAAVLAGYGGLKAISIRHDVLITHALHFAWKQPFAYWPSDMQITAALAALTGCIVFTMVFWLAFDTRWSGLSRDPASADAARALLRKSAKTAPQLFAGRYAGKDFFVGPEDRGLVVGPPGTGKTAFLLNQVLRASKQELSFIAIDIKPELHAILYPSLAEADYRVIRINPALVDSDANHWNPLEDCTDETSLEELCVALLPVRDAREAPFIESQRDWLKAAVYHAKATPGGSLPSAFEFLSASPEPSQLLTAFMNSSSPQAARLARRLAAGLAGQKPDPLILQGLTGALRTLDFLCLPGVKSALEHSDFSVRDIGRGARPTALFLQFEEAKLGALGPLLAFITTAALTNLIDTAGHRKPVAMFLDELGNMPPIPGLLEKLNTIRSRRLPTWMYFQTTEQMNRRYGNNADAVFFASADVQIFFRLNDAETRDLVSRLIGTTQKERRSHSTTSGRTTLNVTKQRENLIEPHELGMLKASEIVCLYRGNIARGYASPFFRDFPQFNRTH